MNDTELDARFGTAAVDECLELHPSIDKPAASKAAQRTGRRVAREQVWDFRLNIAGALWRAMTAEEICRCTGLLPEQCAAGLARMEGEGTVRRVGNAWEKVT